jgi:uncharacterized protein
MEGAVRLFAGEFDQSTWSVPGKDDRSAAWVVTPSGACCRMVYLAGALTEISEEGDMVYARLADPTGGFNLVCSGRHSPVSDGLKKIPFPSFVSVTGQAQMYRKGNSVTVSIRPDHVKSIDRQTRDQWVLATARATLLRLMQMRNVIDGKSTDEQVASAARFYAMTPARLEELALLVEGAVLNVKPMETGSEGKQDVRVLVIDLLKLHPGPRGMAVQEIIDTLAENGVFQDMVLTAIEALIVEDECYQPQKGYIRLL